MLSPRLNLQMMMTLGEGNIEAGFQEALRLFKRPLDLENTMSNAQKRELTISDDDWKLLLTLGDGDVEAGLRAAITLVRGFGGGHGLFNRRGVEAAVVKGTDSLAFANQVKDAYAVLTSERLSRVSVSEYRTGLFVGLSLRDTVTDKRCNVFLSPDDNLPHVVAGRNSAFDTYTGHPTSRVDDIAFTEHDPDMVASYIHRYFTDSVA